MDGITKSLDKGNMVAGVFQDLPPKAFGTINHKILLKKLYGIRDNVNECLKSYMEQTIIHSNTEYQMTTRQKWRTYLVQIVTNNVSTASAGISA